MAINRTLSGFIIIIVAMLAIMCVVPVTAAGSKASSSTPTIEFSQAVDLPSPVAAKSDNAGGNSGNSNAGGNSGNSNAGGNSGNSNAGGNSGNSNAGGNSGNSNAGGNSGNSNAGGNSGNSNAGGNSGGATVSPDTKTGQGESNSLSIRGSQITIEENAREIALDVQKAKDAGETISVQGSVITISKGSMTIRITTTAELKEINGVKTAVVRSISMEHQPITARFKNTGTVSASFKADLMSLPPPDSAITANIIENPGQPEQAAFHQATAEQGYQLEAVAYTMDIAKTNLDDGKDIGPATVTMNINPSWVADHGGAANVRIIHFADDGTSQMLATRYMGLDSSGNQIYEGTSPGGLSIFALITVKASPESIRAPTETAIITQLRPEPTVTESMRINGVITPLLIALPLFVLGIFFMLHKREF
jgi:hypothetical protein